MATPLQSEQPGQPKSMQFAHFGVLDAGHQSKQSLFVSTVFNVVAALVIIVISAAAKKSLDQRILLSRVTFQPVPEKVEPIKPKFVPPPPKPVLPEPPRIETHLPRIVVIKPPDVPKPPEVKMEAVKPVIAPPAPTRVVAIAAPQAVNLAKPQAASVVNNDAHPSAVSLGSANAPVLHGPAVSSVNLGRGLPGMNSAGTGGGPPSTKVNLGNGSPGGSLHGNGVVAVVGIPHGVPAATGTSQVASQVNLGQVTPPPMPKAAPAPVAPLQRTEPKVLYKPRPEYTEEARQLHIEGIITLHIRVMPNGSVLVLNVVNDLGHGLADSAKRAALATKFEPATDTTGQPITWEGVVTVTFQLAG